MTQLELLKYAYVGVLETYTSTKKAMERKGEANHPDMLNRLAAIETDYETIRDNLFAEIEKATGQKYE